METVSKTHINLICSQRPRCQARAQLAVIGGALRIVKENGVYKMEGDENDKKNIDNYGESFFHDHTKKCSGKISF